MSGPILVAHWETSSPYCSPVMWQRLAACFDATQLIMIGHHLTRDLRDVVRDYSGHTWVRLTPDGDIDLADFDHGPRSWQTPAVYMVGPDALPCPEVAGAYDVRIPVGSQELHAITAMTIALWDRRMKHA